jgi:hypothetical protein
MTTYQNYNFTNLVCVALQDEGYFDELFSYYCAEVRHDGVREISTDGVREANHRSLEESQKVDRLVFEKTLQGLKPLIESGHVAIGRRSSRLKVKSGHYVLKSPVCSADEAMEAARQDYKEKGHLYVGTVWAVTGTPKGLQWARLIVDGLPMEKYYEEKRRFFGV